MNKKKKKENKIVVNNANYCICCNAIIPEGRWVCPNCMQGHIEKRSK